MAEQKPVPSAPVAPATVPASAPDLAELWQRVHELAEQSAATGMIVESVEPVGCRVTTGALVVTVRPVSSTTMPPTPVQIAKLETLLGKAAARAVKVDVQLAVKSAPSNAPATSDAPNQPTDSAARAQAANHPLVKRAMELFDARIIRVDRPS